jgi:ATP-dependent exoDNAse (exonuclease V) beta subunit
MLTVYRASAGSGKTFRLTGEYIRLLFKDHQNNRHRSILAVTFTNKATAEMKSRIIMELHKLATGKPSDYLHELMQEYKLSEDQIRTRAEKIVNTILHDFSSFSISTIDKFFQQVIRAFAREIGVHGGYALELDSNQVLEQAVDTLFFDLSSPGNKLLLDWLTRFAEEKIEKSENWNMRANIMELGYEIFKESYQYRAEAVNQKLHDREFLSHFRQQLIAIVNTFIADLQRISSEALKLMADRGLEPEQFKGGSRSALKALEKVTEKLELSASFRKMAESVDECVTKTMPQSQKDAIAALYYDGLQQKIQELIARLDTGIIEYNTAVIVRKHLNTLGILSDLTVQIQKLTNDQNTMLISDSNLLLHKIIDNSTTPFIYEKTGLRIDHFMIDEFQDTSVMQWRNFLPLITNSLAGANDNLVVGDVKQSIYRWRNSDWKLLDSGIYNDLAGEQLADKSLDTNYRSDRQIVEFNNAFFSRAALNLQDKLNESIGPVSEILTELKPLREIISNAYRGTRQHTRPGVGEGYVNFRFINQDESDEKWKETSLEQLPQLVESIQLRGFSPGDIAVLVRTNGEEQQVIEKLLNYKTTPEARTDCSYDIIGNEGLLISSASAVRFITGILTLFIHPDDPVQQAIVTYEYGRGALGLSENEALAATFRKVQSEGVLCRHFSDEENAEVHTLKHLSLFEMCEQLIYRYRLAEWHGEAVFLQAFQDIIFGYSTGKSADLNTFLQWWDVNSNRKTIAMPDNEQAMRVMTIHKSKGLDFKVVIMPFCDWSLDNRRRPVIWCESQAEPFSQLPMFPVEYSSKLGQSLFASQYYSEMMHTYIDNLNVAYVAFTRARNEMHCIGALPKTLKDGSITLNSLSSLLYTIMTDSSVGFECGHFDATLLEYKFGSPLLLKVKEKEPSDPGQLSINQYPIALLENRLRIKHRINNFSREVVDITENPLDYGTLMHEILSELQQPGQYGHLVERLIAQGRITERESKVISDDLEAFSSMPEIPGWFSTDCEVLNETTIVTPQGRLYRPDRVLLSNSHATVVDYKFGAVEHSSHLRQVEQYGSLLQSMGYSCSGFLCYVKLRKVVAVM